MNLTLVRKLGMVHVRAGQLLAVAHDHQVPTNGQSTAEPEEYRRRFGGEKWVTAHIGDLAVEIVAVGNGKVIGHSYIAGDAIQLNRYQPAPAHFFVPARVLRADLSRLSSSMTFEQVMGAFVAMKYAAAPVCVFDLVVDGRPDVETAMNVISKAYQYVPSHQTDEDAMSDPTIAHVIGAVSIKGDKKGLGLLHLQPPRHASDWACSGFQNQLLGTGQWDLFDPFAIEHQDAAQLG